MDPGHQSNIVLMVVRRIWLEHLAASEPVVSARAERLVQSSERPGDIRDLARRLGATIVSLPEESPGTGFLAGQPGDWTIQAKGDVSGELDEQQQFTVAHELSHALFMSPNLRGCPGPCGEQEYWILESVCNRVARILLGHQ